MTTKYTRISKAHLFGHFYELFHEEGPNIGDQVIRRDEVEVCRSSLWMSGLPCCFDPRSKEIASAALRSRTVLLALSGYTPGAGEWPAQRDERIGHACHDEDCQRQTICGRHMHPCHLGGCDAEGPR